MSISKSIYTDMPHIDGVFDPRAHMHRSKAKVRKEDASSSRNAGDFLVVSTPSSSSNAHSRDSPQRSPNRSPTRTGRSTPIINDDGSIFVKREETTPAFDLEQPTSTFTSSAFTNAVRAKEIVQQRRVELITILDGEDGKRKETVNRFFALLLPILLDVYAASIGVQVRTKTFQSMLKIVQYCSRDYLPIILTVFNSSQAYFDLAS